MQTVPTIKLNFFAVPIPDEQLPFLIRPLTGDEKLRPGERRWERHEHAVETADVLGVLTRQALDLADYRSVPFSVDRVHPSIVKSLLSSGLEDSFRDPQYIVESDHLGFACYRSEEVVHENVPPFVLIRRGVQFRADDFSDEGRRIFGFFVSTKVRVQFHPSLALDDDLAKAALEQRVTFRVGREMRSGILTRVDRVGGKAEINDDQGESRIVSSTDVRVPASPVVLSRYCHSLGEPELATQVRRAAQVTSYRLGRNGQRNRRWLAEQMAQVRSWLIAASQYDRLPLRWPNSERFLFMRTRPLEIVERRVP